MTPLPDSLPHSLDRRVLIRARPDFVFRYFTDPTRWAAWWGEGSTIEPRPGGRVYVRYPNAVEASGEVIEVDPPRRVVFSFGYQNGQPVSPGETRVTIELEEDPAGTRLHLRHEFAEAGVRDQHVQGWRYQLSVFANVVCDTLHAAANPAVDAWFAAWSEPDDARRDEILDATVAPGISFRDRFSLVAGLDDLRPHLAAVHRFMPGHRLERDGDVRHCQGMLLADWTSFHGEKPTGRGTNVFSLDPDGRLAEVVGFWIAR